MSSTSPGCRAWQLSSGPVLAAGRRLTSFCRYASAPAARGPGSRSTPREQSAHPQQVRQFAPLQCSRLEAVAERLTERVGLVHLGARPRPGRPRPSTSRKWPRGQPSGDVPARASCARSSAGLLVILAVPSRRPSSVIRTSTDGAGAGPCPTTAGRVAASSGASLPGGDGSFATRASAGSGRLRSSPRIEGGPDLRSAAHGRRPDAPPPPVRRAGCPGCAEPLPAPPGRSAC